MIKVIAIVAALSTAFSVSANTTTVQWDFADENVATWTDGTNTSKSNDAAAFTVENGSVTVEVTGWSDSIGIDPSGTNKEKYDQKVVEAEMYYWGDSNGWGVVNTDEHSGDVPDHSIDNYSGNSYYSDQDMVLLSFSEKVSLEQITVGWFSDGDNGVLDIGAVGISQSQVDLVKGNASTWDDIYNEVDMSTVSYSNSNGNEHYYSLDQDNGASQFWLVGLYNEMAHCDYDAFKLMGVTTKTTSQGRVPNEVPEPSALAIFALGIAFLFRQKVGSKFRLNV